MAQQKKKSKAEAMRANRARMRQDPVAHQLYLMKEKERYKQRKAAGKLMNISKMNDRDKRQLRKKWREQKRKERQFAKESFQEDTPPPSPEMQREKTEESAQKKRGRKKIRREQRQAYRTIAKQGKRIKNYENKIRVLRRKINRLENTRSDLTNSPATKARTLVASGNNEKVRRELTYHFALERDIKTKVLNNLRQHKTNMAIHHAIVGPILKKYRFLHKAKQELKLTHRNVKHAANHTSSDVLRYTRKMRNQLNGKREAVLEFFLQDENSTPAAGKKETITRSKNKRQRRYLTDTMTNLYEKFNGENPQLKVSYTSFTRWRPFYVVPPSVSHRNTVKCKAHCNVELKAVKLHLAGILKSPYLTNIISSVVCDNKNEMCMYRKCHKCRNNVPNIYKDEHKKSSSDVISYDEWSKKLDVRNTSKGEISINQVTKVRKSDTMANLCKIFEEDLVKIMAHEYRIYHQFAAIRTIKNKLTEKECVLQVDFSENYATKAHTEIQSMHFGGNRKQVSIHTCHATFAKKSTKCYATLSDDCRHTPSAVWAHLTPVVKDLAQSGVNTLHVVSDGPTTQYRNRSNFQMMATYPFHSLGMEHLTWTLLEASHGKGPADGIGAAIKGTADRIVATGKDVFNCKDMLRVLQPTTTVKLYEVTSKQIDEMCELLNKQKQMDTIKGTMDIHQLIVPRPNTIHHRKLACFCGDVSVSYLCNCHEPVQVDLPNNSPVSASETPSSAVGKIESSLDEKQLTLFRRRLAEGYDVQIDDLSKLEPSEQTEYLYWKTWRAAKLNESAENRSSQDDELSIEVSTDEEQSEDEGDVWLPPGENSIKSIDVGHYYAVFFLLRRNKTFYIGSPTRSSVSEKVEMKFLEKKLHDTGFVYDWPKRPDICIVERHCILEELKFDGPPPYRLDTRKVAELGNKVKTFSMK